jgi:hypothetical protein
MGGMVLSDTSVFFTLPAKLGSAQGQECFALTVSKTPDADPIPELMALQQHTSAGLRPAFYVGL